MKKKTLLYLFLVLIAFPAFGQRSSSRYIPILDDAQFDIGLRMTSVFALDDRAPLSSNPHYEAMWNLVRLGASIEALLQGVQEPLNNVDLSREFGHNGYNRTVISFYLRYGFGESSDFEMQPHFVELAFGPGYFKEGNGGINIHLDYQFNFLKSRYGSGGRSISKAFDYEVYVGARAGFDWSAARSEGEAGFFSHLNEELERIAYENELTASQLIMLEDLAETSKILLPKDVGGRSFHIGPIAGARISKTILKRGRLFVAGTGFYDAMDLTSGNGQRENKRSQHSITLELGFSFTLGSEGEVMDFF